MVQGLKIPYKSKKHLKWDSIFFMSRPDHFVVAYTDKKAEHAGEETAAGGNGKAPPGPRGGASNDSGGGGIKPGHSPATPDPGGKEEEGD
jgi:hypothetical protein